MKKVLGISLLLLGTLIGNAKATGDFEQVASRAETQEAMREHQRQKEDHALMREINQEMETLRKQLKVYKRLREQSRKGPLDESSRSLLESQEAGFQYTALLVRKKIRNLGSAQNKSRETGRLNAFMDIYERDRG